MDPSVRMGVEDLVGGEDARWAIDLRALLGHQQVVKREDVARTQAIISVDGGFSAALTVSMVASEPEPDIGYPAAVARSVLVRLPWKKACAEATEARFLSSGGGGSPSTSI